MSGVHDFGEAARKRKATPPPADWARDLDRTESGAACRTFRNACIALREHPDLKGKIAYDEFAGCTHVRDALPWDDRPNRPWSQHDDLAATEWLQGLPPPDAIGASTTVTREAVERVAYENRFHPVFDWLETLEWDGTERLTKWLTTYFGVSQTSLSDAIGRAFLISAVARIQKPGCKADHMLILEGLQGALKSTALRTLVGNDDWLSDQIADLGTKDSCQDLRGVWIVELSELSAIRPGEVEKVKAYISRQVDHYRPSYGRRSIDVPRQCVFIGSTNAKEYLRDSTGGRRSWPVVCIKIDLEALARDRDQLWAEAVAAYHAGERWWLTDDDLKRMVAEEQEDRRIPDPWEAIIAAWLDNPSKAPDRDGTRMLLNLEGGRVTIAQILEHAIVKPAERQTPGDMMRCGAVLRLLGWEKKRTHSSKVWERASTASTSASTSGEGGGRAENRGNGQGQGGASTASTCSTHTHEDGAGKGGFQNQSRFSGDAGGRGAPDGGGGLIFEDDDCPDEDPDGELRI
jgi:putative DNA primase/helicase